MHQITGWQLDFWFATERTVCHVSRFSSQVESSVAVYTVLYAKSIQLVLQSRERLCSFISSVGSSWQVAVCTTIWSQLQEIGVVSIAHGTLLMSIVTCDITLYTLSPKYLATFFVMYQLGSWEQCRVLCLIFHFYPHDAMLVRVIAIATCLSVHPSVCPSVRHSPVLCQNEES